jgi:uncharacterized glyoxalase superfamily protein PhnB
VVGETTVIEDNVSILQNVTLGGTGKESGDRHPKIRHGVLIGAGAKILGNIEVGECARVAAGSVVLAPVPHNTTVAGVPAKVVGVAGCAEPARNMDQLIAASIEFYETLGFRAQVLDKKLASLTLGSFSFLLQDFFVPEWAENFMMHLMVGNLDAWWDHIDGLALAANFGVPSPIAPKLQPWGLKVAYVFDPSGVLWHIAERPEE